MARWISIVILAALVGGKPGLAQSPGDDARGLLIGSLKDTGGLPIPMPIVVAPGLDLKALSLPAITWNTVPAWVTPGNVPLLAGHTQLIPIDVARQVASIPTVVSHQNLPLNFSAQAVASKR